MLRLLAKLFLMAVCIKFTESRIVGKFTGLTCTDLNKNICESKVCRIKAVKRDVSEITMHFVLHEKPVDNVTVYFGIKKRGFDRSKSVFQSTVDGCAFMRNKKRNFFAELMFKIIGFEKYSNINHTCPYDHDIFVNHYRLDQSYVNLLPVSQGHYTLFTVWSIHGVPTISVDLNVQFMDT